MNFNIFNSIILAGIIQGFLFGFVWLFSKKYRAKSTYFLIALILVYSLSNLQFYLLDIGLFDYIRFYDLYFIPFALAMPALLLLYGFSLLHEENYVTKNKWLLFIPFVFVMIIAGYYKYQLLFNNKASGYSDFLDNSPVWGEFIAIVYSISVICILLFKIHKQKKRAGFSLTKIVPELNWFQTILYFNIFSITLWAVSEILFSAATENYYYYPLWIVLAVIIYWMGHVGIYKYGITQEREKIRKHRKISYSIAEVSKLKSDSIVALEHFLLAEKNFLDPQLTLEKTAHSLQISTGHLSKLINTELKQSFKDYLNNLRVQEAKLYLLNPDFTNYTLVAIGLEAGFNSKSAFNASFKKITGITPSQFQSRQNN